MISAATTKVFLHRTRFDLLIKKIKKKEQNMFAAKQTETAVEEQVRIRVWSLDLSGIKPITF